MMGSKSSVFVTYKDEILPANKMAAKYKIPYNTFMVRLYRGLSVEEAIEKPLRGLQHQKDKCIEVDGQLIRNLVGQTFGMLTVLEFDSIKNNNPYWLCKCECGNTKSFSQNNLKNKRKNSGCGCMGREAVIKSRSTHGLSRTHIYRTWTSIKQACLDPTYHWYRNIGQTGISMPESWQTFEGFYADMGESYIDKNKLMRLDKDKDFSKENCVWYNNTKTADLKA